MRLCSVARDDDASVVGAGFSAPLNPDFAGSRKHYWGIAIYDSTVSRIASAGVGGQHNPHKCRNHMLRKRKPAPPHYAGFTLVTNEHTGHGLRRHRLAAVKARRGLLTERGWQLQWFCNRGLPWLQWGQLHRW